MTNKTIFLLCTFLLLRVPLYNKIFFTLLFDTILFNNIFLWSFLLNKIISKPLQNKILLCKGTLSNKKVQNKKIDLSVIFTSLLLAYFFELLEPIAGYSPEPIWDRLGVILTLIYNLPSKRDIFIEAKFFWWRVLLGDIGCAQKVTK